MALSDRADRLRSYLANRPGVLTTKQRPLSPDNGVVSEVDKHQTPDSVRRCVASVVNKGDKTTKVDPPEEEKSKAFAVCWDSKNKGQLTKGLSGKTGEVRKSQYKALLKKV